MHLPRPSVLSVAIVATTLLAGTGDAASPPAEPATPAAAHVSRPAADGRQTLEQLWARYESLAKRHGWQQETIYAYPDEPGLAIRAWRTPQRGPALWLLAGIQQLN